jgi:eukaryotic-like serine/threonine-protein kinase
MRPGSRPAVVALADERLSLQEIEGKTEVAPLPSGRPPESLRLRQGRDLVMRKAVGSLLIVTVSFFVGVALFGPRQAVAPRAAAPLAPPRPAPVALQDILLTVTVTPAHARFTIDGELAPANPFSARFPRDLDTHAVRATAPGYEPREKLIDFADNVILDLSLSPRPPAPARTLRPRPAARRGRLPEPAALDRRPIEASNPYAADHP